LGRILLLVIIGLLIWLVFRGFFRVNTRRPDAAAQAKRAEDMVACARCGVNMPRSEAREEAGLLICRDNPKCIAGP
jgi:uncharacterized protein